MTAKADRPDPTQQKAIADRLRGGDFEIEGRMPYSSNGTFLVSFTDGKPSGDEDAPKDDDASASEGPTVSDSGKDESGDETEGPKTTGKTDKSEAPDGTAKTTPASRSDEAEWFDEDYSDDYDDYFDDNEDDVDETREVDLNDGALRAIYKPLRTERPLWDFPEGLYRREVATYEMSSWLGWDIIPTTVEVEGPLGIGSIQRFIQADFSKHYFNHLDDKALHPQLQTLCALDLLTNQTDRKGGHCLIDANNHIWGIDNGLAFHAEFKVRTVIWDFAGEPIADELLADMARLVDEGVPDSVGDLLDDSFERDALLQRARALLDTKEFPYDHSGRRYPWPMI